MGMITRYLGHHVLAVPTQVVKGHLCLGFEGAFPEIESDTRFCLAHVAWSKPEVHCPGMVNVVVDNIMGTLMFVLPTNVVAEASFVLLPSGILCLAPLARGEASRFPENDEFALQVARDGTFMLDSLPAAFRARWRECGRPTGNPAEFFDMGDDVGDCECEPEADEATESEGSREASDSEPLDAWFFISAESADAVVFEFDDHFVTIRHIASPSMDISLISKERCASAAEASTVAFKTYGRLRRIRTGAATLFHFAVGGEVLS